MGGFFKASVDLSTYMVYLPAAEKQSILLNPEVIAIDQDPAGIAGDRIYNLTNGAQVEIYRVLPLSPFLFLP